MTLPRTVADVLAEHVLFEVECIDRMYLNVYVPGLQYAPGLVAYIHQQLGMPVASTAVLAPMTEAFGKAVHRFAAETGTPWVDFAKGVRKDDVAHEYLARFRGAEGVLFIGRAQEKTGLFRTEKRHTDDGRSYSWIVKATGVVNQFYFYCVDEDFGPFFIKFCSYFPYTAKLCINGNEWAKCQAAKAGIGFQALDNGFAAVDDVPGLQAICDRLGPEQIDALLRKWLALWVPRCVLNVRRDRCRSIFLWRCCADDEGFWPFGVALRREALNRLMLRWLKTVVVSDEEKASLRASGRDREGERERIVVDVSKPTRTTSKPERFGGFGTSLAGVR